MYQHTTLDFTGQPIYVGIDTHKKSWQVSIQTADWEHKTFTQDPEAALLARYLQRHFPRATYHIVYEAGYAGFAPYRQLRACGLPCTVVHPADVPTSDKDRRQKTDRRDARKLAQQARGKNLKALYVPSPTAEADRALVRLRSALVTDQGRIKQRIKSLLAIQGVAIPAHFDGRYWSNAFLQWVAAVEFPAPSLGTTRDHLLATLAALRQCLADVTTDIRALARQAHYAPIVALLRSIPGIGEVSAMIWATELIDIQRFSTHDRLAGSVGLVPGKRSSGDSEVITGLDGRGNPR